MLLDKKNRRAAVFEIKRTESSDSMRNIAEEALLQIREKEYGKVQDNPFLWSCFLQEECIVLQLTE